MRSHSSTEEYSFTGGIFFAETQLRAVKWIGQIPLRGTDEIPAKTMEVFTNYSWPGNVRELQNFIERAVILSPGTSLRAPLDELTREAALVSRTSLSTLEEMEREHVLRALR